MKRFLFLWIAAGILTTGCASIEDFKYRSVNRGRAAASWRDAKACMPAECVNHDYAEGYQAGYYAVATGSGSCPPIVPPPRYYHARFQSTAGQAQVNQWYSGYQCGAIAAERDGRCLWVHVPTQDGPGCACSTSPMTTESYQTDVIEVPVDSELLPPQ